MITVFELLFFVSTMLMIVSQFFNLKSRILFTKFFILYLFIIVPYEFYSYKISHNYSFSDIKKAISMDVGIDAKIKKEILSNKYKLVKVEKIYGITFDRIEKIRKAHRNYAIHGYVIEIKIALKNDIPLFVQYWVDRSNSFWFSEFSTGERELVAGAIYLRVMK